MGGGLAVGEAQDGGFDTPIRGEGECAAESEALVVRVGNNTEQTKAQTGSPRESGN